MALCGLVFILLEFHPTGIKLIIICSKKISLFAQLFVIVLYRTKTKKNQNLYEENFTTCLIYNYYLLISSTNFK